MQRFDTALDTGSAEAVTKTLPEVWAQVRAAGLEVPFANLFADRLAAYPLTGAAGALAWRIRLLSPEYEAAARTPPDDEGDTAFLAKLAQGSPGDAVPPNDRAQAISEGFSGSAQPPQEIRTALGDGRLGEVILRGISLFDSGARGNPADLSAALATLRAIGLEDTARRGALQLMLIGRT